MAEGKDTNEMQDAAQEAGAVPGQGETRSRWRRRESTGPQAGPASGTHDGDVALSDEQRALVEQAVQQRLEAEQAKLDEATSRLQRVQADFANYKRRSEQEREQQAKFASLLLLRELLPVLDNFDRALATIPDDVQAIPWAEGLLLVDRQLRATLEKQGLKPIEAVGNRFDPTLHEAIIHEESADHADDEVIAELQRGYMLHDKVVRPTLVKVAKHVAHA